LCCGLFACDGLTEGGSRAAVPDAGGDAPGDATPSDASGGALDRSAPSAGDARVEEAGAADARGSGDATTLGDAGPGDAGVDVSAEAGTLGPLDAAPPSPASVTALYGNPAHTNSITDPSLAPPLAAIWSFAPVDVTNSVNPLIAGGRVYLAYSGLQSTTKLVALDKHTGATLWGPVDLAPDLQLQGQAYDGERVFTVDDTGLVQAFDAASGAAEWTYSVGGLDSAASPTAYRGIVYVAGNGAVTALDEATGQVRWRAPIVSADFLHPPAVTDDGVFVVAGCSDIYAFDRSTGSLLWHDLPTCDAVSEPPMVFDRRIYISHEGAPTDTGIYDALDGGLIGSLPCFTPPAFDNGRAFSSLQNGLQAFDLASGLASWTFFGDGQVGLLAFAAGSTVYVGSATGMMFGVDEATGSPVWSTQVGGLGTPLQTVAGEGVLLTTLFGIGGLVAYAHADVPDAGVALGDGGASVPFDM
jgi:outer membrane protein assembly factor BamB